MVVPFEQLRGAVPAVASRLPDGQARAFLALGHFHPCVHYSIVRSPLAPPPGPERGSPRGHPWGRRSGRVPIVRPVQSLPSAHLIAARVLVIQAAAHAARWCADRRPFLPVPAPDVGLVLADRRGDLPSHVAPAARAPCK